jgi:hypothetical protein
MVGDRWRSVELKAIFDAILPACWQIQLPLRSQSASWISLNNSLNSDAVPKSFQPHPLMTRVAKDRRAGNDRRGLPPNRTEPAVIVKPTDQLAETWPHVFSLALNCNDFGRQLHQICRGVIELHRRAHARQWRLITAAACFSRPAQS